MAAMDSKVRLDAIARFKRLRTEAGFPASYVGRIAGVSASTVHRWESPAESANPSSRQLIAMCKHFNVSPTWLLFGIGPRRLSEID